MATEHQYWDAPDSGETFAVRITDGQVTGAVGPLHYTEITAETLANANYDTDDARSDAEWVSRDAEAWRFHERAMYTPEPEPDPDAMRRYTFQLRVSRHELDDLQRRARAARAPSVSEYVRQRALAD